MSYEEALNNFMKHCESCKINSASIGAEIVCDECKCKNAITSLEKQIPKKPRRRILADWLYDCPNPYCNRGEYGIQKSENFCKECGQAIDWSDEK